MEYEVLEEKFVSVINLLLLEAKAKASGIKIITAVY